MSSISSLFCGPSVPGRPGILLNPAGAGQESTLRDVRSSSASGSMGTGAHANYGVISARYKKNDAGADGVGVGPEVLCPGVSRAPCDSPADSGSLGSG